MGELTSLDSLRCFLAAARTLNFRRAARAVALTPTAFGQRIHKLEELIGARLFARTTREVMLTEAGLTLVPAAERCLEAADACERAGRGDRGQPPMDLTLGTRHELAMSWVLPQRERLLRSRPWLTMHLYVSSGPDLLLRIRTLEIDCAITSTQFSDPKLDARIVHREDYAFVGKTALLRDRPIVRSADAATHTLLDISPDLPLYRYFRDAKGAGDRLHFASGSWLGSIAAIRRQVLEGEGVAVLPEYFVREDLAKKRLQRVLPAVKPLHDHFRLVFRAADPRRVVFESLAIDLASAELR